MNSNPNTLRRPSCNEVGRKESCIAVVPSDPPHTSDAKLSSAQIWTLFQDALRGHVSKKIAVAADVDDVLQDIFIRIHKGTSKIREAERVQSWVFAVAHGAIADYYRK